MSKSAIQTYFKDWSDLFGNILRNYFRGDTSWGRKDLGKALWAVLRNIEEVFPVDEKSSKIDLFLKECANKGAMGEGQGDCDGRLSRLLLMDEFKLETNLLSETLIRYGFQYGYDQGYYKQCCRELLFNKTLEVNGMLFRGIFSDSILDNGNLRMQLGIELLLTLFSDPKNICLSVLDGRDLKIVKQNQQEVIRYMWRATPFPFITGEELFNMLHPHCHYEGDGPSLQDMCDAYVECNTIFEVPVKTQPRSLMDLSKIQIRKTLHEAEGINDEAIDSLQLPRTLHNYLKLVED